MEIYRNDVSNVTLSMPTGFNSATVELLKDGTRLFYGNPVSSDASSVTLKVPFSARRVDGPLTVVVSSYIDSVVQNIKFDLEVVTPLFTISQLRSFDPDFIGVSNDQIIRLERIIRGVIETLTRQSFGYTFERQTITGNGNRKVRLPRRLISANSMNVMNSTINGTYFIDDDGWTLVADNSSSWVDILNSSYNISPIRNPDINYQRFMAGTQYTIEGYFGYSTVPNNVNMAAMILAGDYGCDESIWRERYISNTKYADSSIWFNSEAFRGTGNVVVDQLLQPYYTPNMAVV